MFDQEYFCPHCGAILNDQLGFDPDNGTWTCTECGQMLMDDDIYNGDTFEGVAWFCDNCGALLNRQDGFSDSYGSWRCTECGHVNGTMEDDIINGLKCPRCGALLELQGGFNKYDDNWECTECGAHLHHSYCDDEYEEVEEPKYRCPNCEVALDSQWGFTEYQDDWECTECGAHLHHSYSGEAYTVINHICPNCSAPLDIQWGFSEFLDDWECTECGANLHRDYSFEEYSIVEDDEDDIDVDDKDDEGDYENADSSYSYSSESNSRQSSSKNAYRTYQSVPPKASTNYSVPKTKKKSGYFLILILLLLLLGAVGYMGREYIPIINEAESHPGEIKLTYSASSYIDENYYSALIKLLKQGLSDIRFTPLNDLEGGLFSSDGKKDGKIETIEINGISDFQAGSWVSENSVVSISYHTFEKAEKAGYETSKNKHLIINGMDIELPSYFVEDTQDTINAVYHVKGDDETSLTILFDYNEEWAGVSEYDTHFVLEQRSSSFSGMPGKEMWVLGKKNDKVNLIHATTLNTSADPEYLHIIMTSPDNSKIDYDSDYKAVVSGIYIPKESEIRIDFTSKDYKGKNINDVVAVLEEKGFQNVKTENLQDIVLGVFTKEGAVENITIDGSNEYKIGDWISNQSEIVITYHGKK